MSQNDRDFAIFSQAVAKHFEKMCNSSPELFRVDVPEIFEKYLDAYPEGSNPIFRTRREYDCSCCKRFVRVMGGVVTVNDDGSLNTIWDIRVDDPVFQTVADFMANLVRSVGKVTDLFRHFEVKVGEEFTHEILPDGSSIKWKHFMVQLPNQKTVGKKDRVGSVIEKKDNIPTVLGNYRSSVDVFDRAIAEISPQTCETVQYLFDQNLVARGNEMKPKFEKFVKIQKQVKDKAQDDRSRKNLVWKLNKGITPDISHIRNSSIGSLIVDLDNGADVDHALKSYEYKVCGANYKRPVGAIVNPKQLEKEKQALIEAGFLPSLERRRASLSDINVNDVLFADASAKPKMVGNILDEIFTESVVKKGSKKKPSKLGDVQSVSLEEFVKTILPHSEKVEVFVENKHEGRFVNLITAKYGTAPLMFKWNNAFSWDYNGNNADSSIVGRVKAAGGNVDAPVRFSLGWFNTDDLDLSMVEPDGRRISFISSEKYSPKTGGRLDVDMNAFGNFTRQAVENIFYQDPSKMIPGVYTLRVHNFRKRETVDVGFHIDVNLNGEHIHLEYPKAVKDGEYVTALNFEVTKDRKFTNVKIGVGLTSSTQSKEIWGIQTGDFVQVQSIMTSPNYWGGQEIGNKHFFFFLKGCKNDGESRGFFNEFFNMEAMPHKRHMEFLGAKLPVEAAPEEELAGIGFSVGGTVSHKLTVKVTGQGITRVVEVVI